MTSTYDDLAMDPLGPSQRLRESEQGLDREATVGELWPEIKDLWYPVQYLPWAPIHADSRWGAAAYRFMRKSRSRLWTKACSLPS